MTRLIGAVIGKLKRLNGNKEVGEKRKTSVLDYFLLHFRVQLIISSLLQVESKSMRCKCLNEFAIKSIF